MTFKSVSTSGTASSKASSLFDLDEHNNRAILVYRYRSGASGLDVSTESSLCAELDKDPALPFTRVTRKPIPRGSSRLDIFSEDLLLPEERERFSTQPTLKSSVANVGLPKLAKLKHLLLGSYGELYIVSRSHSPLSSPGTSKEGSPESSQFVGSVATGLRGSEAREE